MLITKNGVKVGEKNWEKIGDMISISDIVPPILWSHSYLKVLTGLAFAALNAWYMTVITEMKSARTAARRKVTRSRLIR